MKKYKVTKFCNEPEQVEIERETEKSVFIKNTYNGKTYREPKISSHSMYFDSYDDAINYIERRFVNKLETIAAKSIAIATEYNEFKQKHKKV